MEALQRAVRSEAVDLAPSIQVQITELFVKLCVKACKAPYVASRCLLDVHLWDGMGTCSVCPAAVWAWGGAQTWLPP